MATDSDLCFACWSGDAARVAELLASTANIDVRDRDGRTPLINAALNQEGNGVKIIHLLLQRNPDVNAQDRSGWSPMHFAAQEGALDVARLLIDSGALVDSIDAHGNTPLMNAVFNSKGNGQLIQLLRARGADPYCKNNHGQTPVGLARLIDNYDVAQFFADLPDDDGSPSAG